MISFFKKNHFLIFFGYIYLSRNLIETLISSKFSFIYLFPFFRHSTIVFNLTLLLQHDLLIIIVTSSIYIIIIRRKIFIES